MELIYLLIAALLPALLLIYYIFRRDQLNPEPKWQLVKGFFFGVASACLVLMVFAGCESLQDESPTTLGSAIFQAFCYAAIPEELSKLLMLWLLVRRNKFFDENIDGIVYSVCVGMGFAGAENILYLISNYDSWVYVGISRALISVPCHFFLAVVMGYYYSLAHFGDTGQKRKNLCLAIIVPILIHGAFDSVLSFVSIVPVLGLIITICFFVFFKKIRLFASGRIAELYKKDESHFQG